jgi:hypothetical protein
MIVHNLRFWRISSQGRWTFIAVLLLCCAFSCNHRNANEHAFWKRHNIDNSSSGADGVRLADVNGDGLSDITTGWEEGGFTKIYIHPGYEAVKQEWPSVKVGQTPSVEDAVFADLDLDGNMDVISSTEGSNRKMYIHWSPNQSDLYLDPSAWMTEIIPSSDSLMQWMFAFPVQLDGQNGPDIIAGAKGKGGKLGWFESPSDPRQMSDWVWHPISEVTWIMSIILSDMDLDGDLDVVVSDRKPGDTNGVRWLENPGEEYLQEKSWRNHFIGGKDKEVMFMDLIDIDNDGLQDVLVCERTTQKIIIWQRLDQSGINWKQSVIDLPQHVGLAKAVRVADMDANGVMDIVLTTNTMKEAGKEGIVWFSFQEPGNYEDYTVHSLSGFEGYKFDRLELVDLDGDDDLDVLTCEENFGDDSQGLGVIWYENPLHSSN